MNTSKYITRTVTAITVNCTAVNMATKAVEEHTVVIPNKKYTVSAKEKAVQSALPAGSKLVSIDSEHTTEELRGMLVQDFIKLSTVLTDEPSDSAN